MNRQRLAHALRAAAGFVIAVASACAGAAPPGGGALAEAGRKIAEAQCAACHGAAGNSGDPQFPRLAGQVSGFTELQLRNYRSGERPHAVMAGVAKLLSDKDIAAVSAYYAQLPPMRHDGPLDARLVARGEAVYNAGKPGAPACQYCHGARGEGAAPVFARIGGQHPEFIVASLQPYRLHSGFKNPYANVMKAVVQAWSDEDIKAVAAYAATLK